MFRLVVLALSSTLAPKHVHSTGLQRAQRVTRKLDSATFYQSLKRSTSRSVTVGALEHDVMSLTVHRKSHRQEVQDQATVVQHGAPVRPQAAADNVTHAAECAESTTVTPHQAQATQQKMLYNGIKFIFKNHDCELRNKINRSIGDQMNAEAEAALRSTIMTRLEDLRLQKARTLASASALEHAVMSSAVHRQAVMKRLGAITATVMHIGFGSMLIGLAIQALVAR